MNTLLLEHFDQLISTPEDVEKLNRVILQLAVRGQLVEQDPNNETAHKLIKRLQLAKQRKIKIIGLDEEPYDLPKSWTWVKTGELFEIVGGGTPSTKVPEYWDGDIPWITSADILAPKEIRRRKSITNAGLENSTTNLVPPESVIVVTRVGLGKVALNNFALCISQDSHALIENREFIYPEYALYCLLVAAQHFREQSRGTTIIGITRIQLENVPFPLPPYQEQIRIVQKIEELFAQTRLLAEQLAHSRTELDRLNESILAHLLASETLEEFNECWCFIAEHFGLLTSAPEHIAPLRQSILELAVRGQLTRREPSDEPASTVIQKIRKAHKTKLAPIADVEMPYELPEGWEWIRFGEVGDQRLGKMLDKSKNKGEYYPYLRNVNVQWLRIDRIDINQMRFQPDEIEEYKLKPNDLLICEGGEPGRCAIWDSTDLMMFQKAIHRVRPYHGIVSKYLLYHLWADAGNGTLEKYFTGATIKHLTGKALAQYICALPPVAEQERIVKRVEQLLGWCDALEAQLRSAEEERGRLVESVLASIGGRDGE